MKSLLSLSVMLAAFAVQAQTGATKTTTTTTTTTSGSASSPSQACSQLIEATKANNFDKVAEMMAMPRHKNEKMPNKKAEAKFDDMHKKYLSEIQNMTCSTEQIAGDHATVIAETQNERRLIPFVQTDGQWKFDMHTYRALYMMDEKMGKGKKSKSM